MVDQSSILFSVRTESLASDWFRFKRHSSLRDAALSFLSVLTGHQNLIVWDHECVPIVEPSSTNEPLLVRDLIKFKLRTSSFELNVIPRFVWNRWCCGLCWIVDDVFNHAGYQTALFAVAKTIWIAVRGRSSISNTRRTEGGSSTSRGNFLTFAVLFILNCTSRCLQSSAFAEDVKSSKHRWMIRLVVWMRCSYKCEVNREIIFEWLKFCVFARKIPSTQQ